MTVYIALTCPDCSSKDLVKHGKARYRGLAKVQLQHILTATAINFVRMVAWLDGIPLARTRISRFALLRLNDGLLS